MLRGIPDEWGPKFERDGGAVARTRTGPNAIHFTAPAHMVLVMFTAQPQRQVALNSDKKAIGLAPVGSLEIIPQHSELFARWVVEKQNLLVAVDGTRFERLAGLEFDRDTFELHPPKLGFVDDEAYALARRMRQEVENADLGSEESLDALVTVFSTYLLRNYSSLKGHQPRVFNGGLPPGVWRRVNDFIQGHLSEHLSLERLAAIAHLSPSHFARAFKQTTGQSPHQYVISSRLAHARSLIASSDTPLSQIAMSTGFSSNSHMTAMMRQVWGATPTEFRRGG
ncbi:AraC family transcriptional regulator [Bosea caraganae]|uniref:AraC family transcriptional regulator n=1 Tax=Bosea caraganae TaxID=2763117 RepID=A0A370KXP3_9HYPH|nr:AraC family transcriptional regulator [Bosea caraganae]RDJ19763.1 AraC family transcriptional regulator [Bosea caraganae]RDJ21134.1 AraC family transcriptional regulator [Bosea caraganae]